jgi:xanthine dehydrogenase accessory factor
MVDVDLDDEVLGAGMPCGGSMRVYIEPVIPRATLWSLGHGRVAECLCRLGAMMSFDVVVNDTMASWERFPDASRIVVDDASYTALTPATRDFVIVATQHKGDHESLRRLLASDVGYIALIASSKRTGLVIEYLRNAGFDQGAIDRIHAPAGIEIGARTAEEIALSVMSEVVLSRRVGAVHKGIEDASATEPARPPGAPRRPVVLSQVRTLRAAGN